MDDEEAVRSTTSAMLQRLSYRPELAADGERALAMYAEALRSGTPYDAVLMDITIPGGMGGVETIARLRELHRGVKAIVSSGYSNDAVMADFTRHGFVGALVKPYEIDRLGEALHRILKR